MIVQLILIALAAQITTDPSSGGVAYPAVATDQRAAASAEQITRLDTSDSASLTEDRTEQRKALALPQLQNASQPPVATEQAGPKVRGTSADQLATRDPSATAPPNLSSVREGRSVAVIVVEGKDRCEPIKGIATREECADILDNRAEQFAHATPPEPSAEDEAIALPPSANPAANAATAARNLAGAEASNPVTVQDVVNTEATLEGVQQATLAGGFGDRAPPAVPASVASVFNSAAAGSATTTSSGVVVTTTPPPK